MSGALFEGSNLSNASFHASRLEKAYRLPIREPRHACIQANFTKAKLHNSDWTRALIGEYPSLVHESEVLGVAVHGAMTVTGCRDGKVRIWQDDKVLGTDRSIIISFTHVNAWRNQWSSYFDVTLNSSDSLASYQREIRIPEMLSCQSGNG